MNVPFKTVGLEIKKTNLSANEEKGAGITKAKAQAIIDDPRATAQMKEEARKVLNS